MDFMRYMSSPNNNNYLRLRCPKTKKKWDEWPALREGNLNAGFFITEICKEHITQKALLPRNTEVNIAKSGNGGVKRT